MDSGDILRGALALFGVLALPGLAISPLACLGGRTERALFVLAGSLAANAYGALLLTLAGLYTRAAVLLLLAGWVVVGVAVRIATRRHAPAPPASAAQASTREERIGYAALLIPLALLAWLTLFFPITDWDGMASWNRWARNLYLRPDYLRSSAEAFFYPLLHSVSISMVYKALGSLHAERAAHGLALAYVVILLLAMNGIRRQLGDRSTLALLGLFGALPFAQFAPTLYADIASAAFELVAVLLFLRVADTTTSRSAIGLAALAGGAGAVAALMKQSGLVALAVIPLSGWLLSRRRLAPALAFVIAAALVLLPWTLAPHTQWWGWKGQFLTQEIHGGAGYVERLRKAMAAVAANSALIGGRYGNVSLIVVVLAAASVSVLRQRGYRVLLVLALAHATVWAFFFSYDTRLLMPVYPLLALCAAGGMAHAAERTRWPRAWSRVGLALGVVMVLLFAGYAVGAPQGARYAWAPYRACFRVHPLASDSREIRERLVPGMRAVEAWKVKWPLGNTNRYWAMDPRLLPYFDDRAVDGRGAFLLPYVGGEAPWLDHDLVLLPADTDSATTLEGDWLRDLLQRGRLGRVGEAGGWAGYVVAK